MKRAIFSTRYQKAMLALMTLSVALPVTAQSGLYVSDTGNVGIGTSSPGEWLQVEAAESSRLLITKNGVDSVLLGDGSGKDDGILFLFDNSGGLQALIRADGDSFLLGGRLGIGTANPNAPLHLVVASSDDLVRMENIAGTCVYNPSINGGVSCSSDERLKADIRDAGSALAKLKQLRIRDYTLLANGQEHTGVIAQEVQEVFPERVSADQGGLLMVHQPNGWELIKAIQELDSKFSAHANVPAAGELDEASRLNPGQFQVKLLEKIEELTLRTLQLQQELLQQREGLTAQATVIEELQAQVAKLGYLTAKQQSLASSGPRPLRPAWPLLDELGSADPRGEYR